MDVEQFLDDVPERCNNTCCEAALQGAWHWLTRGETQFGHLYRLTGWAFRCKAHSGIIHGHFEPSPTQMTDAL